MADIFISYKREEQPVARRLADALKRKSWSIWWDPILRAGERFDNVIGEALKDARAVIVIWSKLSVNSNYIRAEASYALDNNKLIPIAIEEVELPFRFHGIHTLQLYGWDGSESFPGFIKLVEDITSKLASDQDDENGAAEEELRNAEKKREFEKEQKRAEVERKAEEERKLKQAKEEAEKRRRKILKRIAYATIPIILIVIVYSANHCEGNRRPPPPNPGLPGTSGQVQTGIQYFQGIWKNNNESLGILSELKISVIDQKVFVRGYQNKGDYLQELEEVEAQVDKPEGRYRQDTPGLKIALKINSIVHRCIIIPKADNIIIVKDEWLMPNQRVQRAEYEFRRTHQGPRATGRGWVLEEK